MLFCQDIKNSRLQNSSNYPIFFLIRMVLTLITSLLPASFFSLVSFAIFSLTALKCPVHCLTNHYILQNIYTNYYFCKVVYYIFSTSFDANRIPFVVVLTSTPYSVSFFCLKIGSHKKGSPPMKPINNSSTVFKFYVI